jgi:hypothetical protein
MTWWLNRIFEVYSSLVLEKLICVGAHALLIGYYINCMSMLYFNPNTKQTNSVAFSPQANYTHWATMTAGEVAPTFSMYAYIDTYTYIQSAGYFNAV